MKKRIKKKEPGDLNELKFDMEEEDHTDEGRCGEGEDNNYKDTK